MKFKVSKKQIRQGYNKILSVGYCDLEQLLSYESPIAYSASTYGWSCDYYDINGVIICTGYSTIGDRINYDLIREYNKKAYDCTSKEQFSALLEEFIEKATQ